MTLTPYKRKAFYYETDRMDIIHHSNYVRWLEEARVDLMEQLGCPFHEIEARGIVSPVLSVETHYKYPVRSSVNCTPIPLCLENRGFNGMYICVLCITFQYERQEQSAPAFIYYLFFFL